MGAFEQNCKLLQAAAAAHPNPHAVPAVPRCAAAQQQQVDMVALEAEMRALAQQIQAQPDMTEEELQQVWAGMYLFCSGLLCHCHPFLPCTSRQSPHRFPQSATSPPFSPVAHHLPTHPFPTPTTYPPTPFCPAAGAPSGSPAALAAAVGEPWAGARVWSGR